MSFIKLSAIKINIAIFSDLVDYQSCPDGFYKYVLVAQDHCTKYVILRALCTKEAPTVASHLFEIFCTFGAPKILHSDNGREFVNKVSISATFYEQLLCSKSFS